MKELIGKTVQEIFVNEDQSEIVFNTKEGIISYRSYGDCCSETWFSDITGLENLLNHKIINVENVEMESVDDDRTRQEYDSFYGVKITTDKGYVDIIYRNSSNGYYGGDINLANLSIDDSRNWENIVSDWSA